MSEAVLILSLKLAGMMMCLLALVHAIFPKYFSWKEELSKISLINKEMMWVHMGFVALTVFLMGVLCMAFSEALVQEPLGMPVSWGLAVFWGVRLLVQFFGYSSALWKGKKFETVVHVLFVLLWSSLTLLFVLVALHPRP